MGIAPASSLVFEEQVLTLPLEIIFWASVGTVLYVYAGHPAVLWLIARVRPHLWTQRELNVPVTVYVSAFNEEKNIGNKLRNVLLQDYAGPLTVVIANDGSTDRTAEQVRAFDDQRIRLYDFKQNRGKAIMQNEIVPQLTSEITIFSDATSAWEPGVVRKIVRNFADENVGCVAADLVFVSERDGIVEKGQGAYWKYERFLRTCGALAWTNIVASGTTYSIRTSLFSPIRPDIGEDLSNPLQIAMRGMRVVFDPDVVVEERSSTTHASELKMRKRIAVRNVTGLATYAKFLNPIHGFAAYQLLVHKYLRVFCWLPMLAAMAANCLLIRTSPFGLLLIPHLAVYGLALLGYVNVRRGVKSRISYLFYYFVLLNYSCMTGFVNYMKGERRPTWTPER